MPQTAQLIQKCHSAIQTTRFLTVSRVMEEERTGVITIIQVIANSDGLDTSSVCPQTVVAELFCGKLAEATR